MTDDRNPGREPTPDGYFNFYKGKGNVSFLDENGRLMTVEEFEVHIEQKRQKKDHRVIGTGITDDPYRLP